VLIYFAVEKVVEEDTNLAESDAPEINIEEAKTQSSSYQSKIPSE